MRVLPPEVEEQFVQLQEVLEELGSDFVPWQPGQLRGPRGGGGQRVGSGHPHGHPTAVVLAEEALAEKRRLRPRKSHETAVG